ncbi:MAG: M20/M25/M40 family metallo-hydrolase [Aggregatilineales bacterium]
MRQQVQTIFRAQNWRNLDELSAWVVEEGIRIQQIAAPTFEEAERAKYVAAQFTALGLENVEIDAVDNVYGVLPGQNRTLPALMLMAHTDTVFPMETDLSIVREGNRISGVGLGDNCMGVSGMMGAIKYLREQNITLERDIYVVAPVCEEGLGDLKGARAAWEHIGDKIGAVINLEGLAFGHVYRAGIAVKRLHIQTHADGGHSWLHYGKASATHAMSRLAAQIAGLELPVDPRTTCNIGMMSGGEAINGIARHAELWLDMRSESQSELEKLDAQVMRYIDVLRRPDLRVDVEVVGNRPAGSIETDHPLVQVALETLALLNIRGTLERGSTDGNIPLYHGCPTITVGITRGGNAHRLDEYIEVAPVRAGMQQLITLVLVADKITA